MESSGREVGATVEADVAIVGAGLAGLVAARRILAAGAEPVVLEARDRVGGRLLSEEIGDGKVVEVGGQWIGPTQERIAALDFERARARLDRMSRSVPLEEPWLAAPDWDGQTFATWVRRNTRTAAARTLFEFATEAGLDGAVQSGEPAADEVLATMRP